MAVAVEQHLLGFSPIQQAELAMVEEMHQVLLEGVTVRGDHGKTAIAGEQRSIVVHHCRPVARLQKDDWDTHPRLRLEEVQDPARLALCARRSCPWREQGGRSR